MSRRFRTYHEVAGESSMPDQVAAHHARLRRRLESIGAVVPVLSGKGGVGKSALTANLARRLAGLGRRVGALDADLNGPSLARMLGASGPLGDTSEGVVPATGGGGVPVVSMELLQGEGAPLRWREPESGAFLWQSTLETGVLREFLSDVSWGSLDALLVDVPPGTDKIRRLLELVPRPSPVLLVTTPSPASVRVVTRSARLLRESGVQGVGLVVNMAGHACTECGSVSTLFPGDDPEEIARALDLPLFGAVPFDPELGRATDGGRAGEEAGGSPAGRALDLLADRIDTLLGGPDARATGERPSAPEGRPAEGGGP